MANKKEKDIKVIRPDQSIFKKGFRLYSSSSKKDYIQQREKKEGLQNIFLEKLNLSKDREPRVKQLIDILKKNGWKIKGEQ